MYFCSEIVALSYIQERKVKWEICAFPERNTFEIKFIVPFQVYRKK